MTLIAGERAAGDAYGIAGVARGSEPSALVSLVSRRATVVACREALAGLRAVLVACSDRDLGPLAGELAEVRALAGAGIVAVTAEAEARGVVTASQCASTAAWVADAAWHSRREAATIAKAAALFRQPDCVPVADAVCAGDVDLPSAVACGLEFAKLAPDLTAAAKPVVLEQMLDVAGEHGPTGVRRLKDAILARYGDQGGFEEQCERRRRHIDLSAGRHTAAGLWDYRLTVDGEGRAVLEAAIGPGSAPKPAGMPDLAGDSPAGTAGICGTLGAGLTVTTRDTRPVGRRRGEALIDALRRSVTAAQAGRPSTSPKAILILTMTYQDLAARIATRPRPVGGSGHGHARGHNETPLHEPTAPPDEMAANRTGGELTAGAGTVLGSRATGELLDPGTVRRIACDAGIIPAVLGSRGETLDQGRLERVFTLGQVRALWRRDRHCTFPNCDIPAAWCDAHHLVHWIDGGPTDPSNAALLCPRHHTIVHRDQLAGHVTDPCQSTGAQGQEPAVADTSPGQTSGAPPGRDREAQHRGRHARRGNPAAHVIWDLRPGTYRVPGVGAERLIA